MAANFNTAPAVVTNANFEKAAGFLNVYLPSTVAGKRIKLGAIPLKDSKVFEKDLMNFLETGDTEAAVAKLMAKMVIEYQPVRDADPKNGFDLS